MRIGTELVVAVSLLVAAASNAAAADLIPYQSTGWSYQQVTPGDPLEATFMQPGFDDSGWAVGQAAFGRGQGGGCPLDATEHSPWDVNSAMLLRRTFAADPGTPLTIHFSVDNDATVWLNGQLVGSVVHENCPGLDDWNFTVPAAVIQLGANLVAVRALDRGGDCFFDLRVEGDLPVPTRSQSWGHLKSLYR